MIRVLATLMLALALLMPTPANAGQGKSDCVWKQGDNTGVKFCLIAYWEKGYGNNERIKYSRLCAYEPNSRTETGYRGFYDLDMIRRDSNSGIVHGHWAAYSTGDGGGHCWSDWHDSVLESGIGSVSANFDVRWAWWPNDYNVSLRVTIP